MANRACRIYRDILGSARLHGAAGARAIHPARLARHHRAHSRWRHRDHSRERQTHFDRILGDLVRRVPCRAAVVKSTRQNEPIYTIALQSGSADTVRAYLAKNGLNHLTVINDPDGQIAKQFGVGVTPTLFFLGPDGRIAMAETGITSPWGIRLRLWWLGLGLS